MAQTLPVNTNIIVTPDLYNQLLHEHEMFSVESKKSDKEFDSSNETQYYIISTKFLKQWEEMLSQALTSVPDESSPLNVKTPEFMNSQLVANHLTDFNEHELKLEVQQQKDYKIYNYSVMQIFGAYEGARIPRRAYFHGVQKKIQLYPIKFQFAYVSRNWFYLLEQDQNLQLPILTSLGYKNQSILDLSYRMIEFSKKDPRNRDPQYNNNAAARVYFSTTFNAKQHAKFLRDLDAMQRNSIEPPGTEIKTSKIIGDIEIPNEPYTLIIQLQEDRWLYKYSFHNDNQSDRCQFCRQTHKKLVVQCKCKEVKYCSLECKEKDWRFHAPNCQATMQEDKSQPMFQIKQESRKGLVGLANLGNTCFMNAALQCMIHTKDLTEYFRSKNYIPEINETNPIGSKGKLIKSYAKFIQSVLVSVEDVVTPSRLKFAIGKTKEMFSGYEQHDSQEFLLFILDTLHQDLNRVVNKPLTAGVENEGRPDHVVAKESWITYLRRNQSKINDLMGGQYRSEVKCPDCNNISVTFDPFLIFAVPIPSCEAKSINIYYFYSNYQTQTLKITLTSKNNQVKELREDLATKTKTNVNQILFFVSGFNGSVRKVDDMETVDKLINQKQLNQGSEEKQLFAMQFQEEQLEELGKKKFFVFKFVTKSGKTLAFKRPFPMMWAQLKGIDMFYRVCQFLLSLSSRHEQILKTERELKLNVFKTKNLQKKTFKILLCHGKPIEIKNKLIYDHKIELDENTNVTQLLQKYNFEVEFQVEFAQDPQYSFNSYKSYTEEGVSHYDYGEGPKIGSDEKYTLEQCLDQMKLSEKLVQGNQVFCAKCQDFKLAEKKMQMYKASKYLILQLRRFKQIGYQKSKNYAQVKFPLQLNLQNHLMSPGSPQNYFMQDEQHFIKPKYWQGYDTRLQTKYKLYGVVNHHGGLNGGHYTAFASYHDKWYKFDDRVVTQVEPHQLVTSAAYLLFYERQ